MKYKDIWNKVLNSDEAVEFEFSLGNKYIKFYLIFWSIVGLILLLAGGIGVFVLLFVWFYFGFYVRKANAYAFTKKRVLIHRGWLSTSVTSIDYAKITDIHVKEPYFEKSFTSSGCIVINTAGTGFLEVILNHVENPYEIKKKLDLLMDK